MMSRCISSSRLRRARSACVSFAAYCLIAAIACLVFSPIAARAAPTAPNDRMVVEAKEMVYNRDTNTVAASGNVQIFYKGRLLEADRVTYNQTTQQVLAEGNARLTERDGSVVRAEKFELTDDFKAGFIDSLQYDTTDKTHMSSARGELIDDYRVLEKGSYTACEACRNDPSRPRLWQIKAKRIIHDSKEKMVYYEDASFEFLGTPIAYLPYLSQPDPTVKRKTGFLLPGVAYANFVGAGIKAPFFWAISPDADLTVTPTYFTKGDIPYVTGEFRKRFENGQLMLRADGAYINETARKSFLPAPAGAGDRAFRGMVQSRSNFDLNDRWKFGWDGAYFSDRYFLQDFGLYNTLNNNFFFRESASTVYLTGQGPRSYFDMRGYYFQGLLPSDIQAQMPVAHPMVDYNRVFDIDPDKTAGIGGQVEVDANFNSISASLANYQSIQPPTLGFAYGSDGLKYQLYDVCQIYSPNKDPNLSQCLLRGVGGAYTRGAASALWKRKVIDPLGGAWTPFAFARFMGSYLNYNESGTYPVYNGSYQPIPNANQAFFIPGQNDQFRGQATPGMGVDYRYPVLARSPLGNVIFEPIVQLITRPNQTSIPSLVNLDAQSLVFDDSNLFEWSKFSGYDRFETGTRLNYGGQATMNFVNGGFINAMAGQSQQVAGPNAYSMADAANVGLASGLNTRTSDFVGRLVVAPASFMSFTARGRFDKNSLDARRIDLLASLDLNPVTVGLQYANYVSQPQIGFNYRREGLSTNAKWDVTKNYYLNGSVTFDMSRGGIYSPFYNTPGNSSFFASALYGFGGGYNDECMNVAVNYSSVYQPWYTGPIRNETLYLAVNFRTLGEVKFNANVGQLLHDGIGSTSQ
jgi:LPS-assembly protein